MHPMLAWTARGLAGWLGALHTAAPRNVALALYFTPFRGVGGGRFRRGIDGASTVRSSVL